MLYAIWPIDIVCIGALVTRRLLWLHLVKRILSMTKSFRHSLVLTLFFFGQCLFPQSQLLLPVMEHSWSAQEQVKKYLSKEENKV